MKKLQFQHLYMLEELQKQLSNGTLHAGDVLPSEQEWATLLSVKKREARMLLQDMERIGILSDAKDGRYCLTGELSENMRKLFHISYLLQDISPLEVCQTRRSIELAAFPMVFAKRERLDLDELKNALDLFCYGNLLDSIQADVEMHRWLVASSGNRLMECIMEQIRGVCSEQIELLLSDGTEEMRRMQSPIHERIYKSLVIGDLEMGMDAIRAHYDVVEKALRKLSNSDFRARIA